MPPKGGNAKKEAGRAKKAENEGKKRDAAAADKERKVAATWEDGARAPGKKEAAEEKRRAELARKAENARALAAEEAALPPKAKAAPRAGEAKKKPAPGPAAEKEAVEAFAASGIDDALALLDVVNAHGDRAAVGAQAAGIERHPERRFKAAFAAFEARELPRVKEEHPGLRLQQYRDLLYKLFQKSPDNPFNQTLVAYDATKEDKVDALRQKNEEVEERLRDRTRNLSLED